MVPLDDPTDCPYYLISRATLAITARLRRALADAGAGQIRVSYLGVLMALWQLDDLKTGDLGRRAGLEPSTMTGLLDRMERDELVERKPDPKDRRAQRIHLTEAGRTVQSPIESAVDATMEQVMAGVPDGELDRTKQVLLQILHNTEKPTHPEKTR
jgi:DNA-binding MarR family transcriptional regulator